MDASLTTIVIPTLGRPSLRVLLDALARGTVAVPGPVIVVDDRIDGDDLLSHLCDIDLPGMRVIKARGGGPARARNLGWRHASTPWISFLDDDVIPDTDWSAALTRDLTDAGPGVVGSQGRVRVPLPADRKPTDWERSTAGLASARWITADMTYRRSALSAVGGFDERFPRAYREDADLGLRITAAQGDIITGSRGITHPVRPADDWASVRQQAGNADDFLMRTLHGPGWRERAGAPRGRRPRHLAVAAAAGIAVVGGLTGRRRVAALAAIGWAIGTAEFAWTRIRPGPRNREEVRRMVLTSAAIPLAASWHSLRGLVFHRRVAAWAGLPELVLFDRDGTLVHDVPYNGDPDLVDPVPHARDSLDRLRAAGVRVGLISNQSGVARGRITVEQVDAVNNRLEELVGRFDVVCVCPHAPGDGCACRKPAPGMVKEACVRTGAAPGRCVVVGDIGTDVEAATAAGAHAILVPTDATRPEEVASANMVAATLPVAVERIVAGYW
jgi:HAD superfamily hydrolase (TIGR01662 family)